MNQYTNLSNHDLNTVIAKRLGFKVESFRVTSYGGFFYRLFHPSGSVVTPSTSVSLPLTEERAYEDAGKWASDVNDALELWGENTPSVCLRKTGRNYTAWVVYWSHGAGEGRIHIVESQLPARALSECWLLWKDSQ